MVQISTNFDSGNITVLDCDDPANIRLEIPKDAGGEFNQWFHFRVSGARGVPLTLHIENASQTSYPKGWEDYRAVVSEDRESWTRAETSYDGRALTISYTAESDAVWFAYFAPYSLDRLEDLKAAAQASGFASLRTLGQTLDGRDLDMLTFGAGEKPLWFIARQHPGESMASWFMEGLIEKLCDPFDPIARGLMNAATLHVVPNMNPDGSYRGYLRTNAAGANLNREWKDPSMERSPEVFLVRQAMEESGMAMCLDAHGDEGLPYNFIAGYEGLPDLTEAHLAPLNRFREELSALTPDFQTERGYPKSSPGKGNLTTATGHLSNTFRCPVMTLEMPFKDTANNPLPEVGWSPDRCKHLAHDCLRITLKMMDDWGSGL